MARLGRAFPAKPYVIINTMPLTIFGRIKKFFRTYFIG